LELTFPGKHVVFVCEVLTKTSALGSVSSNPISKNQQQLADELDILAVKLKPFLGNRAVFIRLTLLDGLLVESSMKNLYNNLFESLKGKKLGTGLLPLIMDLVRVICLSMQLPVAGLFVNAYLALVKKAPNHRGVFE